MKNTKKLLLLSTILFLTGCGNNNTPKTSSAGTSGDNPYSEISPISSVDYSSVTASSLSISETSSTSFASDSYETITDLTLENIAYADNTFTISGAGTFVFQGNFNGNIVIDAGDDDEVEIDLKGFNIASNTNSPIFCKNADELKIKLEKDTHNTVYDYRSQKTEDNDEQGNGAIYSKCDTKITGKGSLAVTANYNNGIHSTKDLTLKSTVYAESQIQITSVNTAIKGNDSVTIESGNIIAISTGGDGVKTEDTDVSSKGVQRGTFTMTGGQLDIYACCDGIQASYNVEIKNGSDDAGLTTIPVLNIYTSNYSEYSGEAVQTGDTTMYLRTTSYSTSVRYACLFSDDSGNETWADATYLTYRKDGRSTNYYYQLSRPSSATKFKIYQFSSSTKTDNEANATASMSSYSNINSNYDTIVFSSNGSSLTASTWTSYSSGQGGQGGGWGGSGGWSDGNTDKSEYSAKGIKAENIINILGGVINIKAYDDGIHANYGTAFDNSSTGVGDVVIYGGELTIFSADDGIHADRYLTINGGTIDITKAYEGIEGNYITFAGGYTKVYGTDDGVNAANKAGLSPVVKVTGGTLDVTVYGSDVDGIDVNGTYTQTGGVVVTKGGQDQMSTGLDTDVTPSISGGTLIAFGRTENTPNCSNGVSSKTISGSYSAGTYTISDGVDINVTTTTKYTHSNVYVYTDSSGTFTVTKN